MMALWFFRYAFCLSLALASCLQQAYCQSTNRHSKPSQTGTIQRETSPSASQLDEYDRAQVGRRLQGKIVVPTNQVLSPLGRQVAFSGRPTDVALSPDGRWLAVLSRDQVLTIDIEQARIAHVVEHRGGSYTGIVFGLDGQTIYASSIRGAIGVFDISANGELTPKTPIRIDPVEGQQNALPAGLAIDQGTLYAAMNLNNTLAEIDLATGQVKRQIAIGNAPYDVVVVGRKAYVSNWAGRHPEKEGSQGPSGRGTKVRVDSRRHIASDGSVSVVDLDAGRQSREIVVGLHASGLAVSGDGRYLAVANANSDTVSVIDTALDKVVETISTRPSRDMLFGSAPNSVAISSDGRWLYAANGTNNAVAVIALHPPQSRLIGSFPTGWYPAGMALDRGRNALYVANIKGVGSRNADWRGTRKVKDRVVFGYNSHDYQGTVSLMPLPTLAQLKRHTETVNINNRLTEATSALAPRRPSAKPRPIPQRHGEPSVFKHVLYIIKENRTYDQVFGDIERGEGDPELCIFGREVTPNHHKLADEFVLLDNFYCSGTLSADGHQWTDEAYVTDYIEKGYGGWSRSYPYDGGDALAYASSGFIWDNVLAHKLSLRVYGEFVSATIRWKDRARAESPRFIDCYRDFVEGTGLIEVLAEPNIETIRPHFCPTAIGFPATVPDVHRAQQFIDELRGFEKRGDLPNFMIMLLPNDHTAGTTPDLPTPEAAVADNDLALGRIVEAVSHSRFWRETAIFVVQDDPQNGFDHIDGHRTVALVISPYTRRQVIDSTNYNQTSMVRTMELILGLPPMNQFDASATPMATCFTDEPDFTPYQSVPNLIPLDRLNPALDAIKDPGQLHWAKVSLDLPLDAIDQADEDTFNRILWHAVRGRDDNYPSWAVLAEDKDD